MKRSAINGGDPALLRRLNNDAVLRTIRGRDPMTLSGIATAASLSRQTVDLVLEEFQQQGWVEEVAPGRTKGRPARRYRFRAEAGHVLGIDVGSTSVLFMLADLNGEPVGRRVVTEGVGGAGEDRLEAIRRAAVRFVGDHPDARPRALCLGVPGIVDARGAVRHCDLLPEWNGLALAVRASDWFGCPAVADNDANLAAVAEHWQGAAQDCDDFIHLLIGQRTGAAVVLDGRLRRGRAGAAGEIAGLAVLGWGGTDRDALRGGADVAQVFADAANGDEAALQRVDRFARTYALGSAAMVLTVNPDLVVVGGGLSRAGDILVDPLRRHLEELCIDPPHVRVSLLGVEAVALGALRVALDRCDRELFEFPDSPQDAVRPEADRLPSARRDTDGVWAL
ncbi:ROK family protein [Streptomyces rubiginosohelvolus]|uniref:ROK family transcriptional regulator n=1 Tax=Streptomyces rubiginosohelvolus TaxID=67362 RepID=UPI00371C77F4